MLKNIFDAPVTDKFGATYPPWSLAKPHTGDDRAGESGTPIVVSGVTLGYVGKTGAAQGFHLHVQKAIKIDGSWRFVNPEGGGASVTGTVLEVLYNTEVGHCARILDSKGIRWSYFHMRDVPLVKVGQRIGEVMTADELKRLHRLTMGAEPGPAFLSTFTGRPVADALKQLEGDANRLQVTSLMDKSELTRLHRLAMGVEPGPSYIAAFTGQSLDKSMGQLESDPNRLNAKPNLVAKPLAPGIYEVK